jgi:CRP-like cAMP-binding protein
VKGSARTQLIAPDMAPGHVRLSDRQKAHLDLISTYQRLPAWTEIYTRGAPAEWVFQVTEGVVSTFREMRKGRPHVTSFLFENDLFGLALNGVYASSARALTRVVVRRAPYDQLKALLLREPELEFRFLCKLTASIRHAQRHAIAVGRRSAVERVAMFLSMMEQAQAHLEEPSDVVSLPMRLRDIADFLQLSPQATSGALRELEQQSIVTTLPPDRIRIQDRDAFNHLLPDAPASSAE